MCVLEFAGILGGIQSSAQEVEMHSHPVAQPLGVLDFFLDPLFGGVIGIGGVVFRFAPAGHNQQGFLGIDLFRQLRQHGFILDIGEHRQLNLRGPFRLFSLDGGKIEELVGVFPVESRSLLPIALVGNHLPYHRLKFFVLIKGSLGDGFDGEIEIFIVIVDIQRLKLAGVILRVHQQAAVGSLNQKHLCLPDIRIGQAGKLQIDIRLLGSQPHPAPDGQDQVVPIGHCDAEGYTGYAVFAVGRLLNGQAAVVGSGDLGVHRLAAFPLMPDIGRVLLKGAALAAILIPHGFLLGILQPHQIPVTGHRHGNPSIRVNQQPVLGIADPSRGADGGARTGRLAPGAGDVPRRRTVGILGVTGGQQGDGQRGGDRHGQALPHQSLHSLPPFFMIEITFLSGRVIHSSSLYIGHKPPGKRPSLRRCGRP